MRDPLVNFLIKKDPIESKNDSPSDKLSSLLSQKLLEGLSTDCKVVVEDVLQELAAYSKENKYNFVPINSLISVVDEMYKTYRLNPLMMFKNKLARFEKNNR